MDRTPRPDDQVGCPCCDDDGADGVRNPADAVWCWRCSWELADTTNKPWLVDDYGVGGVCRSCGAVQQPNTQCVECGDLVEDEVSLEAERHNADHVCVLAPEAAGGFSSYRMPPSVWIPVSERNESHILLGQWSLHQSWLIDWVLKEYAPEAYAARQAAEAATSSSQHHAA